MKSNYKRVTDIGYNTGKVIIGCAYMEKPKPTGSHASFICGVLRGTEKISLLSPITTQIQAKIRMVKIKWKERNAD